MNVTQHPKKMNSGNPHSAEYVTLREFIEVQLQAQKEYFDVQLQAQKEYFDVRINLMQAAIDVAYRDMEKRLDGMNEFRNTLKDQGATFFPRQEHEVFKVGIDNNFRELFKAKDTAEGKASQSTVNIALVISVFGVLFGIIGIILRLLGL
jgi:hypothetical protein